MYTFIVSVFIYNLCLLRHLEFNISTHLSDRNPLHRLAGRDTWCGIRCLHTCHHWHKGSPSRHLNHKYLLEFTNLLCFSYIDNALNYISAVVRSFHNDFMQSKHNQSVGN